LRRDTPATEGVVVKGSGLDFDPGVVHAVVEAVRQGDLEVPVVVLSGP
jgi:hypothetical protein